MAVQDKEDMGQIFSFILKQVAQQGFSVMLLVLATVYFHYQNDKLQTKVDLCVEGRYQQMEGKMLHMQTVIEASTRAINRNTRVMQELGRKVDDNDLDK